MLPATHIMTSVNEVRAIDFEYSSPRVVGSASGKSESSDHTMRRTSLISAADPARGDRITNATFRLTLTFEPSKRSCHTGQYTLNGAGSFTPSSCTSLTTPTTSRQSSVEPTRIRLPTAAFGLCHNSLARFSETIAIGLF